MQQHVAHASVKIQAHPETVWEALTNPEMVREYMEGANVQSSWTPGSPITWQGEYRGKPFHDHGRILRAERCRVLAYTHFSPGQGVPDVPENHHTVTIELEPRGEDVTQVTLSQDGNPSEEARQHSEENWRRMLNGLREVSERTRNGDERGSNGGHGMRGGSRDRGRGPRDEDAWSGPERGRTRKRGIRRGAA